MFREDINKLARCLICALQAVIIFSGSAFAEDPVNISMPDLAVKSGEKIEIPFKLSNAQLLAGLKLVMSYDPNRLSYNEARKAEATSNFMQVVNDKNPGELIIVMASAKGITGTDVVLFSLHFTAKKPKGEKAAARIVIKGGELMDEKLKTIDFVSGESTIAITP